MTEVLFDGVVEANSFEDKVLSVFPYEFEAKVAKSDRSQLLELFGPARYHAMWLPTASIYYFELPNNNPCYSANGTWFFVQDYYYFDNAEQAMIFKLRYT